MPQDIRNLFAAMAKKSPAVPKAVNIIDSDDDDIVNSPTPQKKQKPQHKPANKRKIIDSDSDEEPKKVVKRAKSKQELKPVSAADMFGTAPVRQKKSINNEKFKKALEEEEKKRNENFQKTLQQLDDDDDFEVEALNKTLDDVEKKVEKTPSKKKGEGLNKTLDDVEKKTPSKKKKQKEEELNDSGMDPDEERYEKRRYSAAAYQKYLHRPKPARKGEKEMPKGKPDCLKGLCFLKTGVLDSLDHDDMDALVKEHGGRTVSAVSKKVNYLVVGEEPGPAKIEKAHNLGIKQITEDELLDLILTKSGMKPKYAKTSNDDDDDFVKPEKKKETTPMKKEKTPKKKSPVTESDTKKGLKLHKLSNIKQENSEDKIKRSKNDEKVLFNEENIKKEAGEDKVKGNKPDEKSNNKKENGEDKIKKHKSDEKLLFNIKKEKPDEKANVKKENGEDKIMRNKQDEKQSFHETNIKKEKTEDRIKTGEKRHKHDENNTNIPAKKAKIENNQPIKKETIIPTANVSWTDKYKPEDIKSIIGQQGDASNMNKLLRWLNNWHKYHSGKKQDRPKLTKPTPWAKNDDGSYYKCALLSGPPGIGKTTTATLVAKHLGFDIVEMNASDTRSKRLLHEEVSQLLSTKSISSYFKDGSAPTKKHVLLMDEVDGMAGNEDRGGIQELIGLIKNTQVPIICMCNDRQHQKMRSLVNYCMDLRFAKPRIEQIKGAMMSICFKENLKITPDTLNEIITATGNDIRQTLNNLSMWSSADKNITSEIGKKESKASMKDTPLGPWEVIRKVFSEDEHKKMSISDRSRLFFYDYSIGPLFVQENYLQVVPHCDKKKVLERVAAAADAISMGDVVEKKIRSTNNWSLLESQAMSSSVMPGHYMEGHFGGQINFPSWLGKNSRRTKLNRLSSELQSHMRTSMSGSKMAVNLDYVYHLRDNIVRPLAKEGTSGVEKALSVMKSYNLLREDLDSILELSHWPNKKDPMSMVPPNVKTAFTKAYNKEGPVLPYASSTVTKKKTTAASQEDDLYGDEEEAGESDNEEKDDITKDAMIKQKKKPAAKGKKADSKESTSKRKPSTRGKKK